MKTILVVLLACLALPAAAQYQIYTKPPALGGGGGGSGCAPVGSSGQVLIDDGAGGCTSTSLAIINPSTEAISVATTAATGTISISSTNASGSITLTAPGVSANTISFNTTQNSASAVNHNITNTGSGKAAINVISSNTDAQTCFLALSGSSTWCQGVDQSNSGAYVISASSALGTSDMLIINKTTGAASFTGSVSAPNLVASGTLTNGKICAYNSTGPVIDCNTTSASANTASAIVQRDGSGNFSAGTITAALTGTASGNTVTVASGTKALGTGAISSGACATALTSTATGALTTDNLMIDFNADPTAVTGYGNSGSGAVLTIYRWLTADTVNIKVCNNTASSITPSAATLQYRVIR